jgi:hypothetical protein
MNASDACALQLHRQVRMHLRLSGLELSRRVPWYANRYIVVVGACKVCYVAQRRRAKNDSGIIAPGVPCSGHGLCNQKATRSFVRLLSIAFAMPIDDVVLLIDFIVTQNRVRASARRTTLAKRATLHAPHRLARCVVASLLIASPSICEICIGLAVLRWRQRHMCLRWYEHVDDNCDDTNIDNVSLDAGGYEARCVCRRGYAGQRCEAKVRTHR